jgi:hypothetical protein
MTDKKKPQDKVHGEGNYAASRDYDERVGKFVSEKKSEIPKYAKDAEKALEGAEGDKLREAEEMGKAKARR